MSMNLVTLLYLVASVCFIQALKGLSHPTEQHPTHAQRFAARQFDDQRGGCQNGNRHADHAEQVAAN